MAVKKDSQELEHDPVITLFEIDTRPIGQTDIYRFTTMPKEDETPVLFGGVEYTPIDIEATGFKWDGKGAFPRPKIRIANLGGLVAAAIIGTGDLVGSKFTRVRTFAKHLDDGEFPDTEAIFPPEVYVVNQRVSQNKIYIEWELTSAFDQLGVKLPRRQCIRDICTHTYRQFNSDTNQFDYEGASCPYTGVNMFDEFGDATTVKSEDKCSKDLSGCKKRFGARGTLPTRQFPGISRIGPR